MKDVLYLETDEEITSAIDKMLAMKGDSVSIVVPKRSGLLMSIVNLKLLKKAADGAGKSLVLVTGDRTATHLAAKVGLAVASNLKAEPVLPDAPAALPEDAAEIIEGEEEPGAAEGGPQTSPSADEPEEEPDEADEDEEPATPVAAKAERKDKPDFAKPMLVRTPIKDDEPTKATDRKHSAKVPNFMAFQKRTLYILGAAAVLIVALVSNYFLETAKVTLYAKSQQVQADFDFTVDPGVKDSNADQALLAGQTLKNDKTLTGQVTATGTKNVGGAQSTGTLTARNYCWNPGHISAGTVFAANGLNFVSTADVTINNAIPAGGSCVPTTATIPVQASGVGDKYNLAPTAYSTNGVPSSGAFYMTFQGSQMSGGANPTAVKVIQQSDVDAAKAQLLQQDLANAQKDLESKAATGYQGVAESFVQTATSVGSNPGVGEQADTAQLTVGVSYTELAVSKADYAGLIQSQEQRIVGAQNQVYDDGVSAAKLTAGKADSPGGKQAFHFSTTTYAGARLDTQGIAKQLAGKKLGDASDAATKLPGVERADISVSPGWSTSLPGIASHIKVEIKVANGG